MARDLCALRSVAPHDRPVHRGPGRDRAPVLGRRELVRELPGEQGQAARRVQPGRLRDRRRHPLLPGREPGQPRRAAVRAQLGAVPRGNRRLRREARARRAHRRQPDRQAQDLSLPGPGADRDGDAREGDRRPAAGDQVLQHGRDHDRRPQGARPAPRDVRRARPGAVRPLGRARGRPCCDRRGRPRLRPPPGRLACLRHEHARVGLDPVPAAGRVHRRRPEGLPRVASRRRLRGHRLARRQPLLRRHRRLLPDPARPGLLAVREVRPRLRRPRGARGNGRGAEAQEGHAGLERRGRRAGDGHFVREGRPRQVHRPAALELLDLAERQAAARRPGRRRVHVLRLQLQRALDALAGRWSTPTSSWAPRSSSSGARRAAARPSPSSSAMCRRRSGQSSARARTPRSRARRTPRAGARRPEWPDRQDHGQLQGSGFGAAAPSRGRRARRPRRLGGRRRLARGRLQRPGLRLGHPERRDALHEARHLDRRHRLAGTARPRPGRRRCSASSTPSCSPPSSPASTSRRPSMPRMCSTRR